MPLDTSIFENEASDKIVNKSTEVVHINFEDVIQRGDLFLVKDKNQDSDKKCNFLLTKDFLYYISDFKKSNTTTKLNIKAKIYLPWLRIHFYTRKNMEASNYDYFIGIRNSKKSVILKCKIFEEYELWVINLSKLSIQTNFFKKYKVDQLLGEGGSAKVYQITDMHNSTKYACKKFKKRILKNEKEFKSLKNEINILRLVRGHPNIVNLEEIQETEKSIYIITELLEGGKITKSNKRYTVSEILFITYSVISALVKLENLNIVHRDLKPANILLKFIDKPLKKNEIKVIDFGISTFCDTDEQIFNNCGTSGYLAPESFSFDNKNQLSTKMDIFSLGVILFNSLTGIRLFREKDERLMLISNKTCDINFGLKYFTQAPIACKLISPKPS